MLSSIVLVLQRLIVVSFSCGKVYKCHKIEIPEETSGFFGGLKDADFHPRKRFCQKGVDAPFFGGQIGIFTYIYQPVCFFCWEGLQVNGHVSRHWFEKCRESGDQSWEFKDEFGVSPILKQHAVSNTQFPWDLEPSS